MSPEQLTGFLISSSLGRVAVGAICGLLPLALGVNRDRHERAVAGFLATIAAGYVAGLLLAIPVAGGLAFWITRGRASKSASGVEGDTAGRSTTGWVLVIIFFVETIFLAVFWSLFMTFWVGKSFMEILVPRGASFGLIMGIFMTAFMAITFRAGSVTIRFQDREAFLSRLGDQVQKLRLRPVEATETSLVYEPRALFRSEGTRIRVALGRMRPRSPVPG
jgi:hypothetical protein